MKVITLLSLLTVSYLINGQPVNSEINIDEKILFIDSEESLNQQIKQFDGKIIYLDIWATFCTPCIKEFHYKKELNDFFESNDIITLCLCVDKESNRDKWKNLIWEHFVTGHHIFMDCNMVDKYKSSFDISRKNYKLLGHGFPYFLIIGKDGKVAEEYALSPSNKEKLIEQLSKYIN